MANSNRSLFPVGVRPLLLALLIAALGANLLFFAYSAAELHIQKDLFRHLRDIVLPMMSGEESMRILWGNHHPIPVLHLIQLLNIDLFDFRLELDLYLGLFSQIVTAILLALAVSRSSLTLQARDSTLAVPILVFILILALGFNSLRMYTWPLLALGNLFHFLGLLVLLLSNHATVKPGRGSYLLLATAALCLMFTNADWGTVYICAMLVVLACTFFAARDAAYLGPLVLLAAVLVVYQLVMSLILAGLELEPELGVGPSYDFLSEPFETLTKIAIALSSGLFNVIHIKNAYPQLALPLQLGAYVLFATFIATFCLYFWRGLYRVSLVPPALMVVAGGVTIPALVFRWMLIPDQWGLAAPRYAPVLKLTMIGMVWSLWLVIEDYLRQKNTRVAGLVKGFTVAALLMLMVVQGLQFLMAWRRVPHFQMLAQSSNLGIYETATNPQINMPNKIKGISGTNESYRPVLDYLVANQLNVFSDGYPRRGVFARHVASKSLFQASPPGAVTSVSDSSAGRLATPRAVWHVDPEIGKLEIAVEQAGYLRITLTTQPDPRRDSRLSVSGETGKAEEIQLFWGRQHFYFELQKNQRYSFEITPEGSLDEFELRAAN